MAIPQEYIAELSRRTDIVELVRGYVELKRAGRMEKGRCPFHNEKTPSFYVYPETNSFYCFGCGAGGDAVIFMKNIANVDYVEAVKMLAARVGMPMPDEDDSAAKLRGRILMLNREAARFFAKNLNSDAGKQARAYLRARGLADATIRQFGLGYAPDDWDSLRTHLAHSGFDEREMLTADLCRKSERGGLYPTFRGRVIFPIIDLRGNVIAFGGRRMGDGQGAKYLNSSDTPVFKKSRNLFALNIARKSGEKRLILAEGYMDVISLHQAGFVTAVATLGTAVGDEQARLLSDYAEEVVICYDGDEAGQRATQRAIGILRNTPLKVRVLTLAEHEKPGEEDAKDPDEFIKKYGRDKFAQLLEGSGNTLEYALAKVRKANMLDSDAGRVNFIREALDVLAAQASPAEQDIYAGRIAEETNVTKAALLTQLESVVKKKQRQWARKREQQLKDEGMAAGVSIPYGAGGENALGVVFAQQQLVAALIKDAKEFVPMVLGRLDASQFLSEDLAEAFTLIVEKFKRGEYIDLTVLGGELEPKTVALVSKVLALNHDIGFSRRDVEMFIGRITQANLLELDAKKLENDDFKAYFDRQKEEKMKGRGE